MCNPYVTLLIFDSVKHFLQLILFPCKLSCYNICNKYVFYTMVDNDRSANLCPLTFFLDIISHLQEQDL